MNRTSGMPMNTPLLAKFYDAYRLSRNLDRFVEKVRTHYCDGTLQRLLMSGNRKTRVSALVALGLTGTMESNEIVASCLHDEEPTVRKAAHEALWNLWFHADTPTNGCELQRLARLIGQEEYAKALEGLNELIQKSPTFAEAFNQRAILFWRWGEYRKSIRDCEQVMKLNPHHFGAQAGLGQCYLRLRKPMTALKAFRKAFQMNPALEGLEENIQALELLLNEGGGTGF